MKDGLVNIAILIHIFDPHSVETTILALANEAMDAHRSWTTTSGYDIDEKTATTIVAFDKDDDDHDHGTEGDQIDKVYV
jgi:hypothetical protein